MDESSKMNELINIGVALASERRLDTLLDKIVEESRRFTQADGGTLYLREGDNIRFVVSQTDSLLKRFGPEKVKEYYLPFSMKICRENIAGYVAATGEILNIEDVYHLPFDMPFNLNKSFDERANYRSKSMLVIPMLDRDQDVVGVLQLINSHDDLGNVVPFKKEYEKLILSLASQAAAAVRMTQLRDELKASHLEMIERLSVAAEFRDQDTALHIRRMSYYSRIIARSLGLSEEDSEVILFTSPMHDIGKLGVPDSVLLKPGKLEPEEWEEMKRHTIYGAEILKNSQHKIIRKAEIIALSHHEKWNGTGYPNGLKDEEIPLEGRIVALADAFDAMMSSECYKPAFPPEKVEEIIFRDAGAHFDPTVMKAFFRNMTK